MVMSNNQRVAPQDSVHHRWCSHCHCFALAKYDASNTSHFQMGKSTGASTKRNKGIFNEPGIRCSNHPLRQKKKVEEPEAVVNLEDLDDLAVSKVGIINNAGV